MKEIFIYLYGYKKNIAHAVCIVGTCW